MHFHGDDHSQYHWSKDKYLRHLGFQPTKNMHFPHLLSRLIAWSARRVEEVKMMFVESIWSHIERTIQRGRSSELDRMKLQIETNRHIKAWLAGQGCGSTYMP